MWNDELKQIAEEVQNSHLEESPLTGDVLAFLDKKIPKNWDTLELTTRRMYMQNNCFDMNIPAEVHREKVCALEIWCELFNGERKDLTRQKSKEINDIIEKTGEWTRAKSALYFDSMYGRQKGFVKK